MHVFTVTIIIQTAVLILAASPAWAESDVSTLHRVQVFTTIDAQADRYIETHKVMENGDFFFGWSERPPFLAKRLVGENWEILSIHPMDSYGAYFEQEKLALRRAAHGRFEDELQTLTSITKFEEDLFAAGPSIDTLEQEFQKNEYVRVENLHIRGGASGDILSVVSRWNEVRAILDVPKIYPFPVDAGSDTDLLLLSFYPSHDAALAEYELDQLQLDRAATEAGFLSYNQINVLIASNVYSQSSSIAKLIR